MTIDRLRDALEALGPPVTPLELAEMLWLAERLPYGEGGELVGEGVEWSACAGGPGTAFGKVTGALDLGVLKAGWAPGGAATASGTEGSGNERGAGGGTARGAGTGSADGGGTSSGDGTGGGDRAGGATGEADGAPHRAPHRAALHVPRGAPHPGSDADEVLVPAPQALRHELAIQRALRPLKQRVPDRHRRTLDERATAERAARRPGLRPWVPVMTPAADRLLSLALVVDTGPAMTVWRPLARELREAMQRTGAFRDVRVWLLTGDAERIGVRSSPGGPARDPAALVDATGRQVTLVLSDCSGPHWWGGLAAPALHLWARRGPTAILQPLPERLWRRTAAPAAPGRAIASRAGAPNTALRFTPHDGRARLPSADSLPVPVLELAPEWLADWAGLVTASGDHRRDTAVTYVSARPAPHSQPLASEGDLPITERILRFLTAASPTAADLAAHVALSVPALPVMRLIQQRVTPGSRPSDLAEVLLSGLLEPVDAGRGLYDFVPGARSALLETLPRPESLAVADLLTRIGEEIEARAGSATRAFRAVVRVAQGAGSQGLASAGQPFALVSEEALGLLRGRAIRVVERAAPDELPGLDPPASVPSPPGLTNIPARPQPYFVGRHKELAILDDGLLPWSDTYGQQPRAMVVHGPEGVGKSALVAEWASVMATNNLMGPAWWVKANSAESINSGLAGLTRALQPSVASSFAEEEQVAWALRWFGAHENWILVLDDVYSADRMGPLLSSLGSHGFVLMTSRTPAGWSGTATSLALGVCELPDAVKMLNRRAGREVEGAGALCEELGRLPLAVTRAGAFLAGTDMTVDHYRSRLALQEVQVHPDEMAAQGVIKTRLLAAVDPLARQLLLVLAWYGPQPVPRDVLGPESATSDVSLALHFLASCSMIGLTADAVTLQPVLAKAAREPDDDHRLSGSREIDDARLTAALWLRNALPRKTDDPADWPRWRQLLPHIDALLEHGRPVADDRHFVELLARTAPFLLTQGATGKAVAYLERVLRDSQRLYGPEVEQTLTLAAELADAYVANGEAGEAINLYAYMLDAMSGAGRGEDDPDVLWLRAKRASARQDSGDPEGAVRELDEVCHRAASSLGEEHSHTLLMRVSLAGAYRAAGEPVRAVVVLEQTLAVCRRVWGDASADTLAVQMELASVCEAVGDMPRAAEVLEEAVRGLRTVFGYPHPRTFRAMADLAALYAAGGMAGRAVELLEEALAGAATVLGERHPAVLAVRQTLAETWLHDGAPEQAVPVLEEVLSDRGAVLGEDHRDTLRSADSLAAAYGAAGMRGRQRTLYKRTLNARLRMLEANDPETLMSYDRLADAMDGAGPAVVLRVRAHQGRVRTLGEDHPETLAALERLAHALRAAGNTSQALTFFQQSLELRRHTQGPAETDTLRVLGTLARIHLSEGDTAAAITAYKDAVAQAPARREAAVVLERAVAHLTSVLGAGHPEVRDLTKRLARLR